MTSTNLMARGDGECQRDAGIDRGRRDQNGVERDLADCLQHLNHGDADAILDRPDQIEERQRGEHGRNRAIPGAEPVKWNEQCTYNRLGDRIVDVATAKRTGRVW